MLKGTESDEINVSVEMAKLLPCLIRSARFERIIGRRRPPPGTTAAT